MPKSTKTNKPVTTTTTVKPAHGGFKSTAGNKQNASNAAAWTKPAVTATTGSKGQYGASSYNEEEN